MARYYHLFLMCFAITLIVSSCECNKAALEKVKNQTDNKKEGFQNDSDIYADRDDLNSNPSSNLPQNDNDDRNDDEKIESEDEMIITQNNDSDDNAIDDTDSNIPFITHVPLDGFSGIYTVSGSSLKNYLWVMNYNMALAFRITDHPKDYFGTLDNTGNASGNYLYPNGSCVNLIVKGSYDQNQDSYSLSGDICKDSASLAITNVNFSGSQASNKAFHQDFSGIYTFKLIENTQLTTCSLQNMSYDETFGVAIITGMASGGVPLGWIVGFNEANNQHRFYTSGNIHVSGKTISGTFIAQNELDQELGKIVLEIISEPQLQKVSASGKKHIHENGCERVFDISTQP